MRLCPTTNEINRQEHRCQISETRNQDDTVGEGYNKPQKNFGDIEEASELLWKCEWKSDNPSRQSNRESADLTSIYPIPFFLFSIIVSIH